MWSDITLENSDIALNFANETVHGTYNRMGYDNTPASIERRQFHIYIGKVAEQVVFSYLQDVLGLQITQDTHTEGPDQFDFRIECPDRHILGDIKCFHVYRTWNSQIRTESQIEHNAWALVPIDQYHRQPKDLYIFTVILGDKVGRTLDLVSGRAGICFMRWATHRDIGYWEFVRQGTPVFPYNRTRTDNYGQKMSVCRSIDTFHPLNL